MPTLDDLRAVLDEREKFAGDADTVRQYVASPPRRRVLAPALAAAAVIALAVGGVVLAGSQDDAQQPAGGGSLPTSPPTATTAPPHANAALDWAFSVDAVDGYRFTRFAFDAESQQARITHADDATFSGFVTMYSPSVSPKTLGLRVDSQQHVLVSGDDAVFLPGAEPVSVNAADDPDSWPRLLWHYRADAWAEVGGPFGFLVGDHRYDNAAALSVEKQIAEAVQFGDSDPITMPLAVHYVPSEFVIASTISVAPACLGYDLAGQSQPPPASLANLSVCRVTSDHIGDVPRQDGDQIAVHDVGDGTSVVCVLTPDGLAPQDLQALTDGGLQAIADDADTAPSLDDPNTWIPVS